MKRGQKQTKPNERVRNVDDLGRVSIPAPIRRAMGIEPGECKVRFELDGSTGILMVEKSDT